MSGKVETIKSPHKIISLFSNIFASLGLLFLILTTVLMCAEIVIELDVIEYLNETYLETGVIGEIMAPSFIWGAILTYIVSCLLFLIGGFISKGTFFGYSLIILGGVIVLECIAYRIISLYSPYYYPPFGDGITAVRILSIPLFLLPGLIYIVGGIFLYHPFKKKASPIS